MSKVINYFIDRGQVILDAVLVFVVGWYLAKIVLHIVVKMMERSKIDSIVVSFIKSGLDIAFKALVIITAIAQLGVDTSSFVTVLATVGAAIVLGLKDSMTGIVSGMIILFAKPFVKGDIIEVNGYIGKIEEIQLLYTYLMTFDNKMVVIPNNELASSTFVNYSHEDIRRVDLNFDIHYENDVEKAKALILEVAGAHKNALKEPMPYARVAQYGENAITIAMRVWTKTENYYTLRDDLLEQIKQAFDENGIVIPYSQVDVHIHNQS